MATIKVKFRPSCLPGKEGLIYYQVIHQRKTRRLMTGYSLFPSEWNSRRMTAVIDEERPRSEHIIAVRNKIKKDVERFTRIIGILDDRHADYTSNDIISEYRIYTIEYSLFNYMTALIIKMKQNGKIRTAETYTAALNSFKKYNGSDMMLDSITSETMEAYEKWLEHRRLVPNTISFYMRILRAVYNRAVDDNAITDRRPFKHVYTGTDKTVKRAVNISAIKRIRSLDLMCRPELDFARDMFLMSFYFRGMSFIDMAFLLKSDLNRGCLSYRRRKTGQRLHIKWTREMQQIIEKYPESGTRYLLPLIPRQCRNERSAYLNMSYRINSHLKTIAKMADIHTPLTMYVARHTWASIARIKGIPLSVISEGMGHDSETTTQIYLASLDASIVDRANSIIMNSIK